MGMTTKQLTEAQILEVQDRAIRTKDTALLHAAWSALGYDRRYAFQPATERQRKAGMERCAAELGL